jgi:hypothetical protein
VTDVGDVSPNSSIATDAIGDGGGGSHRPAQAPIDGGSARITQ